MWPNPQEPAHLVTVTEEILNGKLHFLCSASRFCGLTLLSFGHYSDHERGTDNEIALFSDKV